MARTASNLDATGSSNNITTTFIVTTLALAIGSMTFGVIVGALGGAALAILLGKRE